MFWECFDIILEKPGQQYEAYCLKM